MSATMRAAFEKATETNLELKESLKRIDAKRAQDKKNQIEAEKKRAEFIKLKAIEDNKKLNIYEWRTRPHGMHYAMRSGIIFADSEEKARKILMETFDSDEITYIGEADCSHSVIETGLYIE